MVGIYKVTNLINSKMYIGQARNIKSRWSSHKSAYSTENTVLYRAMRKYGLENFKFEVIEECKEEELDNLEIYYIWYYNTYIHAENSNGYNMTIGGGGSSGLSGEKSNMYGKRHSEETKQKMSESQKGKVLTEEHRRNIGKTSKGRIPTEETRAKMSKAHNGKVFSEEHKMKIGESQKGGKSHNAKRVECGGEPFDCVQDCADFYGVKYSTMKAWLRGQNKMPLKFVELNLHYKGEEESE